MANEVKIKFMAETSEFREGIKKANSDIKTLDSELKLNSTKLKGNADDVQLLKERQGLLAEELNKSREKVELTTQKLDKAKEIYGEDSQAVEQYQRELINAKDQEEKIRQQLADTTVEIDKQKNAFEGADEKLKSFGKSAEDAGKKMTVGVTTPIVAVGTAAATMSLSFEDSIANINTLLDDDSNLEGYKNSIKNLSNETGMDIDLMASGMYQAISSLGDEGAETEKIFGTMAKSAKAGGAEVQDAVALISAGMKGYDSVSDNTAQKISDLAFQTAKLGVTTFPEMAKSMQPLFPLANSLGLSYEDLFGSMATLTGVTGNTAEVSTQLKAVFSNLMKPTKSMQELIDAYGYSSGQAMIEGEGFAGTLAIIQEETGGNADAMAQLFSSTQAVTAMTALTGSQFETFNDKLGQMGQSAGATETAYGKLETKGDTLRKSVNEIKNTGLELGDTLIETLNPAIEKGSEAISGFTSWFSSLDSEQRTTIITIAGVVAAIGPALIIIGKISTGIGSLMSLYNGIRGAIVAKTAAQTAETIASAENTTATGAATAAQTGLNTAMLACPLVWIVVAIVAVVAAIVVLYKKCEWFRKGIDNISEGFSKFGHKVGEVKDKAVEGIKNLAENGKQYLGSLKATYEENGGGIKGVMAAVTKFQTDKFRAGYDTLNRLTKGKLGDMVGSIGEKMSSAKEKFREGVDKVKKLFDFKFAWPHLKSPSLDVEWKQTGLLVKAAKLLGFPGMPKFSVKWNAEGAIFTRPTIFGYANGMYQGAGEAGMEAALPIDRLSEYIWNDMEKFIQYIPRNDSKEIAEYIVEGLRRSPQIIVMNNRELGRAMHKEIKEMA